MANLSQPVAMVDVKVSKDKYKKRAEKANNQTKTSR